MFKTIKFSFFFILSLLILLSGKQSFSMTTDTPTIKTGTAKITGRIISPSNQYEGDIFVNIIVSHPISGELVQYKAFVGQSGKFSVDVNVETSKSLISLYTSLNPYKSLLVELVSGGTTNVDIAYNSDHDIENVSVAPVMNRYDMLEGLEVMSKMIVYRSDRAPEPLYDKSTAYFLNYAKTILSERLAIVNNDSLLSKELKEVLVKDFRLFLYNAHVLDYEGEMMNNYHNTNDDKSRKPDLQKVDRLYFRFLKEFKLSDPQYLYCFTFPEFQKAILQNEILRLPLIGESDIPAWLASVKVILSDLVGFDDGQYYEVLAANAYARQLNEEVRPLSEKQKENIMKYWKDGEITKILFRKNQQVVELNKLKSPTVVNDISSVSDDKVIETIVAKHRGKVVFIDLWATWCAPCLSAMQQLKSTKNEFRDKDVEFVYITDPSSPRKLWEEKIKGIGDEHYYLKDSQWKYVMNHFEFEYIPSYLLYNKEGDLIKKMTTFPGRDEVKEMINDLL